ncbi:MAG TPA: hypothetical protein VGC46_09655 [Allosphingosinicella sp.]
MGDFSKLIDTGAELAGLKDEIDLIRALADTAEKWKETAAKIDGATTLEKFLDTLAKDIFSDKVKKAFADVGLKDAHATLERLMGKLTAGADKIPESIKKLFNPLSTYGAGNPGLVEWKLSGTQDLQLEENIKLGIGGSAGLEFDAAVKAKVGGTELDRLLRLGAELGVKANASGSLPIRWGSIDASGEASVDVALDYYYQPASTSTFYGVAVAKRIVDLPDPFHFGSVWKALQGDPTLAGIVYSYADKAKGKVALALSATGSLTDEILADVKLTFAAMASRENRLMLTLRALPPQAPGGERQIEAILSRGQAREEGLSVGLKVGVDLSAPVGRVREVLNRAIEKSDALIAEITPYLSPGTLLRTKFTEWLQPRIESVVQDEGLRNAILADVKKATGESDPSDSDVIKWLSDQLGDAIDQRADDLTAWTVGAETSMASQALALLPESLRGPAGDKVKAEVTALVDKARDEFKSLIDDRLLKLPAGKLKEAFKKLGIAVDEQVEAFDELLAPVRKLIDRYQALLEQAKTFANDASRAQVMLSISGEEVAKFGLDEKFVGRFEANNDLIAEVFREFTRGKVTELRKRMVSNQVPVGFKFVKDRSIRKETAELTGKSKVQLVLFGFGAEGSIELNGRAEILVDGNNTIQVDSSGTIKERFSGGGEQREVSLAHTYQMRLERALAGHGAVERSTGLGVAVNDVDTRLHRLEVIDFLGRLEQWKLVASSTKIAATKQFDAWLPTGQNALPGGMSAKLALTRAQLEKFMLLPPGFGDLPLAQAVAQAPLTRDHRKRIVSSALAALKEVQDSNLRSIEDAVRKLPDQFDGLPHGLEFIDLLDLVVKNDNDVEDRNDFFEAIKHSYSRQEFPGGMPPRWAVNFIVTVKRLRGLVGMIQAMRQIYAHTPRSTDDPASQGWDRSDYARAERRVAKGGAAWLSIGDAGLKLSSEIAQSTVAFLIVACALAEISRGGADAKDILTLAMTKRKGDKAETVVESVALTAPA